MRSGLQGLLPMSVLMGVMTAGCWVLDPGIEVDPGYYPSEDDPPPGACVSRLVPSGSVQTGPVSIDYTGGQVAVRSVHKVDVDAIEDRCISRLELTVSLAQGACPLKLVFGAGNGSFGGLTEVLLTADSACPGFLDAVEGVYSSPAGFAPWSYLGPQEVPERQASSVCLEPVRMGFPDRVIRLYRSSPSPAELAVNLKGLELNGRLLSTGEANGRCFDPSACGPGRHDGGDGWCVGSGSCSPGYHLSPTGDCTP
ncbi:hypothetical protein BO221_07990 [Archangium sp. Cb G35]|uniref:hypothetical protein n=1 Tax=Archangium sp. Cb G35 TaxID=1920190 RepID=UPI0009379D41|nr:hypothetical protein [Archangium sp. Cb G35]OJT25783.1 hypothetical protein BO221_07990 [Archangium sp. Cb G35]